MCAIALIHWPWLIIGLIAWLSKTSIHSCAEGPVYLSVSEQTCALPSHFGVSWCWPIYISFASVKFANDYYNVYYFLIHNGDSILSSCTCTLAIPNVWHLSRAWRISFNSWEMPCIMLPCFLKKESTSTFCITLLSPSTFFQRKPSHFQLVTCIVLVPGV